MITTTEEYFADGCGRCDRFATPECSARRWAGGLRDLRRICLAAGLVETAKWGHPCYMHGGRNVAIIGAFRSDFRLSFFYAALMQDPAGVLEKAGPNTRCADMIRLADGSRLAELEPVILSYLREAMGYADAGAEPPQEENRIELPDELVEAMDSDPELAGAFGKLTPGRRKSYLLNVLSTRTPATRTARIAKFRSKILAGKGATER